MSKSEDNVLDLLDTLDVKQTQKTKPKKSSAKRKEAKKATSDDILQFLDELDPKNTASAGKRGAAESSTAAVAGSAGADAQSGDEAHAKAPQPQAADTAPADGAADSAGAANAPDSGVDGGASGGAAREDAADDGVPNIIDPVGSLTSWWSRNRGGLWSKAQETIQDAVSDAMKQARQAEALVREDQTRFSLNSLQSRLTSVLHTIVPPISPHEQLQIHVFHDMVGYPSVDKLLYEVFDYVMDQVEGGGELHIAVQKGRERHRVGSDYDVHRALNYTRCSLADGAKLAKASVEEVRRQKTAAEGAAGAAADPNIRTSEVFIAIQPVVASRDSAASVETAPESLHFVLYLADIDHDIEITTASQALPFEWAQWLDSDGEGFQQAAIDPREWVFGWVEDALNLSFGVVAQKYVTTRMGLTGPGKEQTPKAEASKQASKAASKEAASKEEASKVEALKDSQREA